MYNYDNLGRGNPASTSKTRLAPRISSALNNRSRIQMTDSGSNAISEHGLLEARGRGARLFVFVRRRGLQADDEAGFRQESFNGFRRQDGACQSGDKHQRENGMNVHFENHISGDADGGLKKP